MVLTDAEELRSPVITSDMSFFDLESNHSSDSVHLLCEKYTHKLPIESESQTTFRLAPTKQRLYRQSTLYVPLSLKQRVFLFTERAKSIWAGLPRCKPIKYFKVAFALAVLTPLAIWIFYIDFRVHWSHRLFYWQTNHGHWLFFRLLLYILLFGIIYWLVFISAAYTIICGVRWRRKWWEAVIRINGS